MNKLEKAMNSVLDKLGISYRVVWQPCEHEKHAIIDTTRRRITIFSKTEQEAWATLVHEALELKIRPLLAYYRELVNTLIGFIEKHVYVEKERFLEALPETMTVLLDEIEKVKTRE